MPSSFALAEGHPAATASNSPHERNKLAAIALTIMAESFGDSFTVVEVTADDVSPGRSPIWIALAKPDQALTSVLAAVPEGWTAKVLEINLTGKQQRMFGELSL
ncbi:hypothetical protein [Bradyrhizobium sp. ORS 86]|uniref:hypothetical protein n=1 Tax=unclassified Bradyrhizobium TaxID=2631580 RepID=UPI0038900A3F